MSPGEGGELLRGKRSQEWELGQAIVVGWEMLRRYKKSSSRDFSSDTKKPAEAGFSKRPDLNRGLLYQGLFRV